MGQRWADLVFLHWRVPGRRPSSRWCRAAAASTPSTATRGSASSRSGSSTPARAGCPACRGSARSWSGTCGRTPWTATGRRDVAFCSLDAQRLGVVLGARAVFALPYAWARMTAAREGDVLRFTQPPPLAGSPRGALGRRRCAWAARCRPATRSPSSSPPATGCTPASRGRLVHVPNTHEPWPLHRAELLRLDDGLARRRRAARRRRPPAGLGPRLARGRHPLRGPGPRHRGRPARARRRRTRRRAGGADAVSAGERVWADAAEHVAAYRRTRRRRGAPVARPAAPAAHHDGPPRPAGRTPSRSSTPACARRRGSGWWSRRSAGGAPRPTRRGCTTSAPTRACACGCWTRTWSTRRRARPTARSRRRAGAAWAAPGTASSPTAGARRGASRSSCSAGRRRRGRGTPVGRAGRTTLGGAGRSPACRPATGCGAVW